MYSSSCSDPSHCSPTPAAVLARPQASAAGVPRAVGDTCDCFINGGWWEACKVLAVEEAANGGPMLAVEFGLQRERSSATLAETRSTLRFAGGRWQPVAAPAAAAGGGQQASGGDAGGEQQADAGDADGSPSKKRRRKPSTAQKAAAGEGDVQAEAEAAAAAGTAEATEPPAKKQRDTRQSACAAAAAAAAAGDGDATPAAAGKGKGSKAGAGKAGSASRSSTHKPTPTYEVPADFDASVRYRILFWSLVLKNRPTNNLHKQALLGKAWHSPHEPASAECRHPHPTATACPRCCQK